MTTVQVTMVSSGTAYLERLMQHGAVEGAPGEMQLNPEAKRLIDALHHVLAGGKVSLAIEQTGSEELVRELGTRLEQAFADANAANKEAGATVVTSP